MHPISNIEARLHFLFSPTHGDPFRNGGTNVNVLPNRMDFTNSSVGIGGAKIEPQPSGASHVTNHIFPTLATRLILEYSGPQNGGDTTRQPLNSNYENGMPPRHEVMDDLKRIPLFERSTLTSLSFTLLVMNCCKTHAVTNVFINELV